MRIGPVVLSVLGALCIATLAATPPRDGAVITNSGSTNTAGYAIKLWSDGAAQVSVRGGAPRDFTVDADTTAHFFRDVATAKNDPGQAQHCMKSASFGTSTIVSWHGFTTPDLQCPPLSPSVSLLAGDVRAVTAAADIDTHVRRVPMPAGGLRMIPSAIPEVSPT